MFNLLKRLIKKDRVYPIEVTFIKEACGDFYRIKLQYKLLDENKGNTKGNCHFFILADDAKQRAFYPDSYSLGRCGVDVFKPSFELSLAQMDVIKKRCCFDMEVDTLRTFDFNVKLTTEEYELLFDASKSAALGYLEERTKKILSFFETIVRI